MPRHEVFRDLSRKAYAFLATEYGFTGPEEAADDPNDTVFRKGPLSYRLGFNPWDRLVWGTASLRTHDSQLRATIQELVFAAGLGPLNAVSVHARNRRSLAQSLASHADYVRLLHPMLSDVSTGRALMRKARADESPLRE